MNRNALNLIGESFETYLALKIKSSFPNSVVLHNVWSNASFIGSSTQIDLIVITDKVFVVIEAKNWSKLIQGNYNDTYWIMGSGRTVKPDKYSPLRQNMTHIRALRNCMRVRGVEPVQAANLVVVPNTTMIKSNCHEVIHEAALVDTIHRLEKSSLFCIDKYEYRTVIQQISDYYRR